MVTLFMRQRLFVNITIVTLFMSQCVERLLGAILDDNNTDFYRLIYAYLNTGARRIELLKPQFTWANVDFKGKKIVLVGLKGSTKRYIPMNNRLTTILQEIKKEGHEHPFEFRPDFVTHKIADYYKLAGIEGANLHSLRKTFGSLLLQNDIADLYTVSRLLGHTSIRTTEKYYVDLLDDNYRNSVNGLDSLI